MIFKRKSLLIYLILFCVTGFKTSQDTKMLLIKGGEFSPFYGIQGNVKINDFYMDEHPVTQEDFVAFLQKYPEWKKSKTKQIFADKAYLSNWIEDDSYGTLNAQSPVNYISWFAARKYCECQGKRLPTTDEWEYVARASENKEDGSKDKVFYQKILSWYEKPSPVVINDWGKFKNYWGVYDMHGLIWEWTDDFNSVMISGESRKDAGEDNQQFCGAGALNSKDPSDYAAYMRYALRGSLKANYCLKNLGFRCVKTKNNEK